MSTVHPFPQRHEPEAALPPIHDDADAADAADETLARFGSVGPANHEAHRVINPSLLAAITGYPAFVCEEFHHALFTLLADVGDFDGLLATGEVRIGRADRLEPAQAWLAEHMAIDVDAMIAAADASESDDDMWRRIAAAVNAESLALALAAGSNPSLTLGSLDAISLRIDDIMGEVALSTMPEQVIALTRAAFDLIARLPGTVVITGGAARAVSLTRDTFAKWQP